jgi:peptidyl-prolyl cis-trans isomerase D
MPMMAKMRSLAPAFILTVGALFVLFMIISSSSVMQVFGGGGRSNVIGKVDGENITYQEFSKALDNQLNQQKKQTGKDVSDQDMDQFRNQVWESMITQKLLEQQIKKFGITVSDQEVKDIILSDNPPDFLKRNFIDSTGKFNKEAYQSAIYNPQNKDVLIQAEDIVRQERLREKLQSILEAALSISENEIRDKFIDENVKVDVKYALIGFTEFPDSMFTITDKDLKDYYNSHINNYKILPQRRVRYVFFQNEPSEEDSQIVKRNLENVINDLKTDTSSFKSYVDIYSSQPYSKDTVQLSTLPAEAASLISNAKPGQILGPVATSQGYMIYHLIGILPSKETVVRASHILINNQGSEEKNKELANKIYDQLEKGASFEELAMQYSGDPGSKTRGGDLGWFGKGRMIPAFEKAVFGGRVGEILKPIETQFGYHIIKVTGKSDKKYIIEKIVNPVAQSAATRDANYNNANDFSYIAQKNGFESEAKLLNYEIEQTAPFTKDAESVSQLGQNQRLIQFAFDNDLNEVSDVFKVSGGYAVCEVSEIINAGVQPFDKLKASLKSFVYREKRFAKAKQEADNIKKQIGNNLDKAPQIDPKAAVKETGEFLIGSSIPGIGTDFSFKNAANELKLNQLSNPVRGQRGYYLMEVLKRTPFDTAAYQAQRPKIMNELLGQKKNAFFSEWLTKLKKDADIVDNRYLFYQQ